MTIESIENDLKVGQVPPPILAEMKDWLAGESTSMMDRQNELTLIFAEWFLNNLGNYKTEKTRQLAWYTTALGKEQLNLELQQRKIKTLREAISSHLRVAHDMARNNY